MKKFTQLNLPAKFLSNLESLNYNTMTKIQEESLPISLEGKDLIAQAKTGSGKTVAFSIPIVKKLNVRKFAIQSLVLAPTRELANQIAQEIRKVSRHIHNVKVLTLCGGVPYKPQVASLKHGAHIVVATPGRILQHIFETKVDLSDLEMLVLDEADKMLDMGFYEDITKVIENIPKNRQTMLFSATYEKDIEQLASEITKESTFIQDESVHEKQTINQIVYEASETEKDLLIPSLISSQEAKSVLIFCNTKIKCEELADILYKNDVDVLTLHSDLDQRERDETIIMFSNKSYPVLIATDVASRGLDIDDIDLVINYDLAKDVKTHIHRIGRTARAGKKGLALSFYDEESRYKLEMIEDKFDDLVYGKKEEIEVCNYEIDCDFRTLFINSGKKFKLRAGDILGALTAGLGLPKDAIGKIDILEFVSYVAIKKEYIEQAYEGLCRNKIKGKYIKCFIK
ncbi:ATP-dependent RNA helicase DbpA [Arcobacter sp. CECT 8983]|uniref:ATP-dependent RNA helicase DbpA n=1 Tax=Arcobacter sp. CECT 8983 TaxID=2044508 RepID=UPI00100B4D8A|nr:ATP-dependent RNA helicase DbpA [Arcobacter sp. CECT 8983]RXJ90507.1 ATP-dependent RNA helicase DbpA [Arcobacter sp. CECT 8983]